MNLLEELRAQRERIQQHLQWLEQTIARLERGTPTEAPPEQTAHDSIAPVGTAQGKTDNPLDAETAADAPHSLPPLASAGQAGDLGGGHTRYPAPPGDPIRQAKTGCLILFCLATGLFLFLLFGLPYLLE